MNRRKRDRIGYFFRLMGMHIIMGVAIIFLLRAIGNVEKGGEKEAQKQLEDTIKKVVVNCYATEGTYPPTLKYVEKYYGVLIDHDTYDVFYEIVGDNIMPEITVVRKKTAKGEVANE
ncbi:MAG: hypothetical protein E7222_12950 [Clostridiales bacterium]|nr:hypothetical protein [Clostridiales bacterium]